MRILQLTLHSGEFEADNRLMPGGRDDGGARTEIRRKLQIKKKEEFTGVMLYMLPGNSFPQICVVSEMIIRNVPISHKSTKVLDS